MSFHGREEMHGYTRDSDSRGRARAFYGGFAGGKGNPNLKSSSVRMPIELKLFSRERKWMKAVLLSFACILISM